MTETPEQRAIDLIDRINDSFMRSDISLFQVRDELIAIIRENEELKRKLELHKLAPEPVSIEQLDKWVSAVEERDTLLRAEAELKMRLTECEEDKKMLEWCENTTCHIFVVGEGPQKGVWIIGSGQQKPYPTLRSAIREAMNLSYEAHQ